MRTRRTIGLADARRVIDAGERRAAEIGQPVNAAVGVSGGSGDQDQAVAEAAAAAL